MVCFSVSLWHLNAFECLFGSGSVLDLEGLLMVA